jgi:hypothetical protein
MGYVKGVPVFIAILLTALDLITYMNPAEPQVHFIPAASPAPGQGQQTTFTDPFTYYAVLATIDAPDARYTGPKVPEVVAQGLKRAFGAPAVGGLSVALVERL